MHDLGRGFPALDLCYTDPAHLLTARITAGEDLDDIHR